MHNIILGFILICLDGYTFLNTSKSVRGLFEFCTIFHFLILLKLQSSFPKTHISYYRVLSINQISYYFPDNVTLHLDGVLYYRIIDPFKVIMSH